jgi:hypothetical protein
LGAPGIKAMPNNDETAGLDFLDLLFTVAISVGLTPELLQISGLTGLLSEEWQKVGRWPNTNEFFGLGVFGLGFLNLTLSWFGYRASIKSRPLNYYSGYGMVRFILDVSLVIVYGVILLKYKSFGVVLSLLISVYVIFTIWDLLKIGEYHKSPKGTTDSDKYFSAKLITAKKTTTLWRARLQVYRREVVTLVCCILFTAVGSLYFYGSWNRWAILTSAVFITLFYRFNKNHPTWEKWLGIG